MPEKVEHLAQFYDRPGSTPAWRCILCVTSIPGGLDVLVKGGVVWWEDAKLQPCQIMGFSVWAFV